MGFRFEKAKGPWRLSYESGKYQLSAKTANCGVMVTPNAAVEGCAVEVKGHRLSGTDADYGILFGIGADWASFYEAAISGSAWGGHGGGVHELSIALDQRLDNHSRVKMMSSKSSSGCPSLHR